jgi:PKD repeat protein
MKTIYLAILFIGVKICLAQNPLAKQWDKRFGGNNSEFFTSMQVTSDGQYILGGFSKSGIGGNKTQPSWGEYDYWIIKVGASGFYQWDKRFGGNSYDYLNSFQETTDNGYILGGYSLSGIGGDKTQHSWGGYDYWIVKTDSLGNFLWDKRFGGSDHDMLYSIQQTSDDGYILGGYSWSGISGDKTQPSWGGYDYWIVKTDSLGNLQWDRRFGGDLSDYLTSIRQTTDGGYILAGYSWSGLSGDKTEASQGQLDYWIVKADSLGNLVWDKRFGGIWDDYLTSLQQTSDNGFILGGYSNSGIGGDKTQPSWGGYDYWIVKTDSYGNFQWDRRFGGTSDDNEVGSIVQTSDNGYLIAGASFSSISGDKTEDNLGIRQTWVVKTDWNGVIQWDKTLLTDGYDTRSYAIQTNDGCYLMGNCTSAEIGGDKSQGSWGNNSPDYWVIKFCDTSCIANGLPVASFNAIDSITCENTCTNFISNSVNCPDSWYWKFDGATTAFSTQQNPFNICYNNPGNYDVTLIVTNNYGSDTLTIQDYITVHPLPMAPVITQNSDTLTTTPAFGYQWFMNETVIPGATDQQLEITQTANYSVVVTDSFGCSATATSYFYLPPITNFHSTITAACCYSCIEFSDLSLNNPTSWSWYFPGASPSLSSAQNPTNICYNTPGTYDVKLITSNIMGNDTLLLQNYITIYPLPLPPVITQNIDTLFCSPETTYQWYLNSIVLPGATNQQLNINQPGLYSVVITDSNGCSSGADTTVTLEMPQSGFYSNVNSGCPGDCFDFISSSQNTILYHWLFPGGNPNVSSLQNPSHICYNIPGSYDVTLIASNSYASDTLVLPDYITIFTLPPVFISQNGNLLSCNPPATSYQWYMSGNLIAGATSQSLIINQVGNYSVTVTDSLGCTNSIAITVTSIPFPNFIASSTSICKNFCIDFVDQSTNNPTSWHWSFSGGDPSISTDQNPSSICYNNPGTFDVTLITTNASENDTLTLINYITVYPTPPFPTITQTGYTLSSSSATSYQWQFNNVDIPGATNESYDLLQSGYYTVFITDLNGCVSSTTIYILIDGIDEANSEADVLVYPNPSDGNFTVELLNCQIADEFKIEIRNTLGRVVFHSEEKISSADWLMEIDLRSSNPILRVPTGVFFIEISEESSSDKTHIVVARRKIIIAK